MVVPGGGDLPRNNLQDFGALLFLPCRFSASALLVLSFEKAARGFLGTIRSSSSKYFKHFLASSYRIH